MQLDLQAALERSVAGHYAVTREIGRGGMAVVYEARDLIGGRDVAIKLLYPDLARAVGGERFLREIRIQQQLSHPHILPLLDSGTIEVVAGLALPWYAMPLAREETLRARLTREGALPLPVALGYARDLCAALVHAHGEGIIHRDIKPENILLIDGKAVLADFGVARAISVAGGEGLSTTGIVLGTPAYMSPEQSTGARQLDGRSDLYSLGVVLYEMLAGHPPFSGSTPQAVSARHQFETPPPIAVVRPGLPEGVAVVLERALSKLAPDRFQAASDFADALATLPVEILSPRVRRWRRLALRSAAAVATMLLVGAVGWRTMHTDVSSPALAVLPFTVSSAISGNALCGTDCSILVDDVISRWTDLARIDQMRVRGAVAAHGAPQYLSDAERIARSLGAGRFISGDVYQFGDSLRIRVYLNQLRRIGSRLLGDQATTIAMISGANEAEGAWAVAAAFDTLARRLLAKAEAPAGSHDESLQTTSLAALKLKLRGDSASGAWELGLARKYYREALELDPGYAQARLSLAQFASWLRDPVEEWRADADSAFHGARRLAPRQRLFAAALQAMASGRHLEACGVYRQLIDRDSTDFAAWFGLGDCQAFDQELVRTPASPSGWAWRSSIPRAISAYERALELLPQASRAFSGPALGSLLDRFFVEPNRLRQGRTPGDTLMLAFPMIAGDTLAFVPRPIKEILANQWPAEHPPDAAALAQRSLRRVTERWVTALPEDQGAWRVHALVLELMGRILGTDPVAAALPAIQRARELRSGPAESLDLAATQVRLLIKAANFTAAIRLADSLLEQSNPLSPDEFTQLAGLAALSHEPLQAAAMARRGSARLFFPGPHGLIENIPLQVRSDIAALQVFAVFRAPEDSIRLLVDRIHSATGGRTPTARQREVREAVMRRAILFGFPALGVPDGDGVLQRIERAIARGNQAAARLELRTLSEARITQRIGDRGVEGALLELRLRQAVGDTAGALAVRELVMRNLNTLGNDLITDMPQAASLGILIGLTTP